MFLCMPDELLIQFSSILVVLLNFIARLPTNITEI
jgi:hypothetical protein